MDQVKGVLTLQGEALTQAVSLSLLTQACLLSLWESDTLVEAHMFC